MIGRVMSTTMSCFGIDSSHERFFGKENRILKRVYLLLVFTLWLLPKQIETREDTSKEKSNINIVYIDPFSNPSSVVNFLTSRGFSNRAHTDNQVINTASLQNALGLDREVVSGRSSSADATNWKFETNNFVVTIVGYKDHADYVKMMVAGRSTIDSVVLVVSAKTGDFESFVSNIRIRTQVYLARSLGVNQVIVCCNDMESTYPPYNQKRFDEVEQETKGYLKGMGYDLGSVAIIPTSAQNGDNIIEQSAVMHWWRGITIEREDPTTGDTIKSRVLVLQDAFNNVSPHQDPAQLPLRMALQHVHRNTAGETVVAGRVEMGILEPGIDVTFAPGGLSTKTLEDTSKEKSNINIVFIDPFSNPSSVVNFLTSHGFSNRAHTDNQVINTASLQNALGLDREVVSGRSSSADATNWKFETNNFVVTIVGYKDHADYVKMMVAGRSTIDSVVLVVSAKTGDFESFVSNIRIRTQVYLARSLGVNQVIVCCNDMESTYPPYNQKRFDEVEQETKGYLKGMGYDLGSVAIIPTSAQNGDNIIEQSAVMHWWRGITIEREDPTTGDTIKSRVLVLQDAFNNVSPHQDPAQLPLRMALQHVHRNTAGETVVAGRVETGILEPGIDVTFVPGGLSTKVTSMEANNEPVQQACPGESVSFVAGGIDVHQIQSGFLVGNSVDNPPKEVRRFFAQIYVVGQASIIPGYAPVIHCHTAQINCVFTELKVKLNPQNGQIFSENPKVIEIWEAALVYLEPVRPMSVERFQDFPPLGRFEVRDKSGVVAVGFIKEVEKR